MGRLKQANPSPIFQPRISAQPDNFTDGLRTHGGKCWGGGLTSKKAMLIDLIWTLKVTGLTGLKRWPSFGGNQSRSLWQSWYWFLWWENKRCSCGMNCCFYGGFWTCFFFECWAMTWICSIHLEAFWDMLEHNKDILWATCFPFTLRKVIANWNFPLAPSVFHFRPHLGVKRAKMWAGSPCADIAPEKFTSKDTKMSLARCFFH